MTEGERQIEGKGWTKEGKGKGRGRPKWGGQKEKERKTDRERERERKERQRENVDVGATLTPNMPVNGGGLVSTRGEGKKPTHHIHKTSDNGKLHH